MTDSSRRGSRRILMLIPELGFGGAEQSFLRLAQLLSGHHQVSLAVFQRHYARGNYSRAEEQISLPLTVLDDNPRNGRIRRWVQRWQKLKRLKKDSEITISFLTGTNILNILTPGGKKVISMRGSRRFDPAMTGIKRFAYEYIVDPLTFGLSDRIVSISAGLTNELCRHVGPRTRAKFRTIELFVSPEELIAAANEPIETEIEKLHGEPVLITAGRLSPEKGFHCLIPIFAEVRSRIPEAKLVIIGDGPQLEELLLLCRKMQLPVGRGEEHTQESAVSFLGYRKNPLRYFRTARLFVLSSLTEGFSNSLLEALASGIPVVAVDCPWGPRSVLCRKPADVETPYPQEEPFVADYGVLMPRIDLRAYQEVWVKTLCRLLLTEQSEEQGVKLRHQRLHDFSVSAIGSKWLTLLDEL